MGASESSLSSSEGVVSQAAEDAEAIRTKYAKPEDKLDNVVDLRSDTVTKPTQGMRAAMALAEVGDDVLGDDPTIMELEQVAAKEFGKEAGLFVPSGTMGNLISCMVHCRERGSEMIVGDSSHIHIYEAGSCAGVGGIHPRVLPNLGDGTLDLDAVEAAVRPDNDHFPRSRLLCLENTHNLKGGRVLPVAYMDKAGELAKRKGMKLHLDGARVYNAAAHLKVPVARLCKAADSVTFCLSKGLGAPVGSVIVGTKSFIREARRVRKSLGGGMRQGGVIAAAGLVALREQKPKLAQDNKNAKHLAQALNTLNHLSVDPDLVESNLVYIGTGTLPARQISDFLRLKGILVLAVAEHTVRLVLHHQVSKDDLGLVAAAFVEALEDVEGALEDAGQ